MNTQQKIKRRKTMSKAQAVLAARRLLRHYTRTTKRDDDEWQAINSRWDVNLWEEDGKPRATLYPVVRGQTVTLRPTPITLVRRNQGISRPSMFQCGAVEVQLSDATDAPLVNRKDGN